MFKHYLVTALRNLRRSKTSSLIGIAGLALGLACFIVALGAVTFLANSDRQLPNSDRVLIVATRFQFPTLALDTGYRPGSSWIIRDQIRADFPALKTARAKNVRPLFVSVGDRTKFLRASAATTDYLDVVRLPLSRSADSNPLSVARGIVLSEQAAVSLFGTKEALGKTLTLQRVFDVTVTGVLRDIPQPSHIGPSRTHALTFDLLISEATYDAFESAASGQPVPPRVASQSWGEQGNQTYIQLPADGSVTTGELQNYFNSFAARYKPARLTRQEFLFKLIPLREFRSAALDNELFKGNGLTLSMVILVAAILVLGVASLNYANLSIAESMLRQRDLGLRRALGATRRQILLQTLVESAVRLFGALLIGVTILGAIIATGIIEDAASTVFTVFASTTFWCVLGGALVALNILLSSYCAFMQLRTTPIRSLQDTARRSGSGFGFRFLMSLQFAVAALFLIGLTVSQQQNGVLRNLALHPDEDPIVTIEIPWRSAKLDYDVVRNELLSHGSIKSVSMNSSLPWDSRTAVMTFNQTPTSPEVTTVISMVHYDFENVLSLNVLAGRTYSKELGDREWGTAMPVVTSEFEHRAVVDRTFASTMGFRSPQEAVGKLIYQPNTRTGASNPITIIGVIEDKPYRLEGVKNAVGNLYVLMPGGNFTLVARMDRNRVEAALAAIDDVWNQFVPDAPVKRKFFDEYFEENFQTFARVNQALTFTAAIGLAICASGLFGIALFVANRRSREIGIRKTLGARAGQIVSMLLRDFSKPVLIANLLAWPLAYIAVGKYLERFIERVPVTPLPFVLSLAVTLIIAWLAVGGHAWRVARQRPTDVLRHE